MHTCRLQFCDVCYEHTSLFPFERTCVDACIAVCPPRDAMQAVLAQGPGRAQPHRQNTGTSHHTHHIASHTSHHITSHHTTSHHITSLTSHHITSHHIKPQGGVGAGHPKCQFCDIYLYDNDRLYYHMRERHEQCTVCAANGLPNQ